MDELESVDDSEFIYRRIHPQHYDASLPLAILRDAFRPTENDLTGISVFRARFAVPKDTLPADATKASRYYVARLAIGDCRKLG